MIRTEPITVADDQLRSFYERWLRLETEKQAISDDSKELFAEAKGNGFDTKAMRAVFRDMTKDQAEKQEAEAIYDLYWSSLNKPRAHPAPARVENIEEITPAPRVQGADDGQRSIPSSDADGAKMVEASSLVPERTGDLSVHNNVQSEQAVEKFEPPAFLVKDAKPLRPFCLKPDLCGGYGKNHCHECLKAAGKIEVSA